MTHNQPMKTVPMSKTTYGAFDFKNIGKGVNFKPKEEYVKNLSIPIHFKTNHKAEYVKFDPPTPEASDSD